MTNAELDRRFARIKPRPTVAQYACRVFGWWMVALFFLAALSGCSAFGYHTVGIWAQHNDPRFSFAFSRSSLVNPDFVPPTEDMWVVIERMKQEAP